MRRGALPPTLLNYQTYCARIEGCVNQNSRCENANHRPTTTTAIKALSIAISSMVIA